MAEELPTLTRAEYEALLEEAADYVVDQFEEEVREYARTGEASDDVDQRLTETEIEAVQFHASHDEEAVRLGFKQAHPVYLGCILHYSQDARFTGYYDFVRESTSDKIREPRDPEEALAYAAIFCMVQEVGGLTREKFKAIKADERAKMEAEQ